MLQSKDTDWLNRYKTGPIYMLPTRDSFQIQRHIQIENEGMIKGIPWKWKSKESQRSNTYIRESRL